MSYIGAIDTSAEVQAKQADFWRTATIAEKVSIVNELTNAATQLACIGIEMNYPDATEKEKLYHLAVRRYGKKTVERIMGPAP